ncbi:MAG: hypothetical protein ACLPGW_19570 [Roseiarcus sp.]
MSGADAIVWREHGGSTADGFLVELWPRFPRGFAVWVHTPDGRAFADEAASRAAAKTAATRAVARLRRA